MNCRHCQTLLLREADLIGSAAEQAALAEHLAACPACRHWQADVHKLQHAVRTELRDVPVPDAEAAWQSVRRARADSASPASAPSPRPVRWWLAPPLAAAAALMLLFALRSPDEVAPENGFMARAEFVTPGDAAAATMVFVDNPSGWLVVWATETPPARRG